MRLEEECAKCGHARRDHGSPNGCLYQDNDSWCPCVEFHTAGDVRHAAQGDPASAPTALKAHETAASLAPFDVAKLLDDHTLVSSTMCARMGTGYLPGWNDCIDKLKPLLVEAWNAHAPSPARKLPAIVVDPDDGTLYTDDAETAVQLSRALSGRSEP